MKTDYIITTNAENSIGILYRILNVFSRRMINVESLTVIGGEEKGLSKITFVILSTEEVVKKLIKQIDKHIGVHNTHYHANSSLMAQKISLYRLFTKTLSMHDELAPLVANSIVNAHNQNKTIRV